MIVVRMAQPAEYATAGAVTARAYQEFFDLGGPDEDLRYLRRIADVEDRSRRTTILVGLSDDVIIGSLTLELRERTDAHDPPLPEHRAHIRMLGVDPPARARGAGRALMSAAQEHAQSIGKTEITLHTTSLMSAAHRMYESMGYERTPDEVLPDGFVLMGYRKGLPGSRS